MSSEFELGRSPRRVSVVWCLVVLVLLSLGVTVSLEVARVQRLEELQGFRVRLSNWTGPFWDGFTFLNRRWLVAPRTAFYGADSAEEEAEGLANPRMAKLLGRCTQLQVVQVYADSLKIPGELVQAIVSLPDLRALILSGNSGVQMTDETWRELGRVGRLESLEFFDPTEEMTEAGWAALGSLPKLKSLGLKGVMDSSLAPVVRLQGLSELEVRDSPGLTAASLPMLQKLTGLHSLTLMGTTGISEPELPAFRAALPKVMVTVKSRSF